MAAPVRVFIGSSSEARLVADATGAELRRAVEVQGLTPAIEWWDLSETAGTVIDTLMRSSRESDFGVFVVTGDDEVVSRREPARGAPRDNVVFELGLFTGALGPARPFMVVPKDADVRIPSDLAGVVAHTYPVPSDPADFDELCEVLRVPAHRIARAILRETRAGQRRGGPDDAPAAAPGVVIPGADLLAIEIYADLQQGRLERASTRSDLTGRSVIHGAFA